MKNKKKVIGNTVFFFALFGLTAYAVLKGKELSELAEVLKSVKPAYYIAGLVMIVVFVCCESYIIYRMLRLLQIFVCRFLFQLYYTVCNWRTANAALLHEPR